LARAAGGLSAAGQAPAVRRTLRERRIVWWGIAHLVRSPASAATDVSDTSCAVDAVRRSPARNPSPATRAVRRHRPHFVGTPQQWR